MNLWVNIKHAHFISSLGLYKKETSPISLLYITEEKGESQLVLSTYGLLTGIRAWNTRFWYIKNGIWEADLLRHTCGVGPLRESGSTVHTSLVCKCPALTWFRTSCMSNGRKSDKACSHNIWGFVGRGLEPNRLVTCCRQTVPWDLCSTIQTKELWKHIQTLCMSKCTRKLSELPTLLLQNHYHRREPFWQPRTWDQRLLKAERSQKSALSPSGFYGISIKHKTHILNIGFSAQSPML